ncbi:MAG: cyclic nucleotide-binding domain-containing protein [Rectinemataceae bacterium]
MVFILKGEVDIKKNRVSLARLEAGDTFGVIEFLDVMPAFATIHALVPIAFATISYRAFHELPKASIHTFARLVITLPCISPAASGEWMTSSSTLAFSPKNPDRRPSSLHFSTTWLSIIEGARSRRTGD